MNLALEATKDNVVKSTRRESINDALLRILYEEKQELTRIELVARISLDRLISEHGEDELNKMVKNDREQFNKLMRATNKTVKNGIDQSVSRSNNNASFHYNEKYKDYKLEQTGDKYRIVLRK